MRHPPKGKGFIVYVKGVDTLLDVNALDRIIQTKVSVLLTSGV